MEDFYSVHGHFEVELRKDETRNEGFPYVICRYERCGRIRLSRWQGKEVAEEQLFLCVGSGLSTVMAVAASLDSCKPGVFIGQRLKEEFL